LGLRVIPEGPEGFGFALPVQYTASVRLVHSNYPGVQRRVQGQQIIEMRLSEIEYLSIGNVVPIDNMLQSVIISVDKGGVIHLDIGGDGQVAFACNVLSVEEVDI